MSEKIRAEDEQQPENKEIGESENIGAVSLRKQKEVVWREKEKEIDTWADNLGAPIDAGIKKAVIAFNLAGFPTTASCEGHLDTGLPAPWMRVAVLDEPEQRFVGENEIFQRYADRLNVSLEEMRRMTNVPESEYWQAAKECSKNEETEEYRRWFEETQKIRKILIGLVKEFYQLKLWCCFGYNKCY